MKGWRLCASHTHTLSDCPNLLLIVVTAPKLMPCIADFFVYDPLSEMHLHTCAHTNLPQYDSISDDTTVVLIVFPTAPEVNGSVLKQVQFFCLHDSFF